MKVELIDKMGSDLSVVNAARVSYSKIADEMTDKDEKLIKYLVAHDHWSPFAHATIQFRIQAPIYVARQLVKHQVGLSWNEVSRRYVSYDNLKNLLNVDYIALSDLVSHKWSINNFDLCLIELSNLDNFERIGSFKQLIVYKNKLSPIL